MGWNDPCQDCNEPQRDCICHNSGYKHYEEPIKDSWNKEEMLYFCQTAFIAGFGNGSLTLEAMLEVKDQWMKDNIMKKETYHPKRSFTKEELINFIKSAIYEVPVSFYPDGTIDSIQMDDWVNKNLLL